MVAIFWQVWAWVSLHPWVWITFVVHFSILGIVAYLILLERKVASWVQDRIGPNRVGFDFGLFPFLRGKLGGFGQPLADGLKFILKEDYAAKGVDKVLFTIAPGVMIIVIIISIAVVPWGGIKQSTATFTIPARTDVDVAVSELIPATAERPPHIDSVQPSEDGSQQLVTVTYRYPFQITNLNIGVLYVLAVLSLGVYGVVIGGWASNNKYSFLGGLRATANMISYEIPLGLAVLCIVLLHGTLDLGAISDRQCHYWLYVIPSWNCFTQPLAFLMFLICIHAEANRAPFDLAEAEQELVGGYHTEYSAMRFALFFLAEYAGMITTSAVCVALFFGGWHLPWLEWLWPALRGDVPDAGPAVTTSLLACLVRTTVFAGKTGLIIFVFMWTRWSLPRFRFDQLMMLAWRALIPLSLALVVMTAVVIWAFGGSAEPDLRVNGWMALALIVANAILLSAALFISTLLPPAPATNRKMRIPGSRYAAPIAAGGVR